MPRFLATLLGVLSPLALCAASAQAQTLMLAGPDDFSGAETLVTFDDLGLVNGDPVTEASGVTLQLDGVAPANYYADAFPREFDPQGIGVVTNFWGYAVPYPDLSMQLPGVMNRVAFAARVNASDEVRVVLMRDGGVVDEVVVPSRGSDQLYFYGVENPAGFDEVLVDVVDHVSGAFTLDNVAFESLGGEPDPDPTGPMVLSCDGFHSPWEKMLEHSKGHHRGIWKHFVDRLPLQLLQARLFDPDGVSVGGADLVAPPMVHVDFFSARGGDSVDVTDAVFGNLPEVFSYNAREEMWHLLLPKKRMRGKGTYVVTAESGDGAEYTMDPTCTTWVSHDQRGDHHGHD